MPEGLFERFQAVTPVMVEPPKACVRCDRTLADLSGEYLELKLWVPKGLLVDGVAPAAPEAYFVYRATRWGGGEGGGEWRGPVPGRGVGVRPRDR